MKLAEVTPIFESNFRSVPDTLRVIATEIEQGKFGNVERATLVIEAMNDERIGHAEVFGMGSIGDLLESVGLLHLGINWLTGMRNGK